MIKEHSYAFFFGYAAYTGTMDIFYRLLNVGTHTSCEDYCNEPREGMIKMTRLAREELIHNTN